MKARVYIDGRRVAEFDYEYPVENDRLIELPRDGEIPSECNVFIQSPDGRMWMSSGKFVRLEGL